MLHFSVFNAKKICDIYCTVFKQIKSNIFNVMHIKKVDIYIISTMDIN